MTSFTYYACTYRISAPKIPIGSSPSSLTLHPAFVTTAGLTLASPLFPSIPACQARPTRDADGAPLAERSAPWAYLRDQWKCNLQV